MRSYLTSDVSVYPIVVIMGHRKVPKHFLFPIQGTSLVLASYDKGVFCFNCEKYIIIIIIIMCLSWS